MAVSSIDDNEEAPAIHVARTLTYVDASGEPHTLEEAKLGDLLPPLVVLGEPGMGKTWLLKTYAKAQGFAFMTARALTRRPPAELRKVETAVWVIDALDEVASAQGYEPVQSVLARLAEIGSPPFILSCRSADWQGAVAKYDIKEDYGAEPTTLQLDPLSASDACRALTMALGDEAVSLETIDRLGKRGLEPLYGNPLTLSLIADLTKAKGKLPDTRADLFQQACDLLWREKNSKHRQTLLSSLTEAAALDAAGVAFAALILTGSEAISLETPGNVQDGDLRAAEIAALPDGAALEAVLHSRLFRRAGGGDRLAPLHRTIAEYLGGRWLAAQFATASRRRIFSMLHFRDGVPASLRGLHAWLAHFNHEVAEQVIETDPFGVLRYGDADRLTPIEGAALLRSLKQLAVDHPYFRGGDWTRYSARGLAQEALAEEVRALALDPNTPYQLRTVLMDALKGSPAATLIKADLLKGLMDDGKRSLGRDARRSIADILIALQDPKDDWPAIVDTLSNRKSPVSRYLAVDIIVTVGSAAFSADAIAHAVLAHAGRLKGLPNMSGRTSVTGPLYTLARQIPLAQIDGVLDAYIAKSPTDKPTDWNIEYALNDFIATLITRRLEGAPPDPVDLLRWIRIHSGSHMGGEKRKFIREWMKAHDDVRRAIQTHVLFVEKDDDDVWGRAWGLNRLDAALVPDFGDVTALLDSPHLTPLSKSDVKRKWRDVVQLAANSGGLPEAVSLKAGAQATGHADLEAFLDRLRNPAPPEWEAKEAKRKAAELARRAREWAKHRETYRGLVDEVRAGELSGIHQPALAYIGHYFDLNDATDRHDRIRQWLGEDLLEAALEGFEAVLRRNDLPGSQKIAESYAESRTWNYIRPMLVGLLERVTSGRGLADVHEDVLISGRLGMEWETLGDGDENQILRDALDAWLAAHPAAHQTYIRLLIEPQLRKPREVNHINGLYQLTRHEDAADLVTPLASEWLSAFPDMPAEAEIELVDHLTRFKAWDRLRAAAAERRTRGYRDDEHRLLWLSVAFLADFETARTELDAGVKAHPTMLWHLRNRGGLNRSDPSHGGILPRACWLVRTFRREFPARGRPSGSYGGNENAWDASDFLQGAINTIASDLTDEAANLLIALRDGPADTYSESLRNAVALQARARREEAFEAATLPELASVVASDRPRTVEDLRAVVLDALDMLQARIKGDDFNTIERFYNGGVPLDESGCRDVVGGLLRDALRHGIQQTPERLMPAAKRADLAYQIDNLQLPVEAKGQWHPKLWTAANGQLDKLYTTDWRAVGMGIYVVFWFGPGAPESRKLKGPPKGTKRPTTPEDLKAALIGTIPEHRRNDLSVVVLDLTRRLA
jgi:hypothetical protein